jgi:hypothetical protein
MFRLSLDYSGCAQPFEAVQVQTEGTVNLVVVLAKRGSCAAHRPRRDGKARHHALHADIAELRVGHADNRFTRSELRISENVRRIVDRREADFMPVQALAQLGQRALLDRSADDLVQRVAILHA